MNNTPLWQQYGFSSQEEFEERYPKSRNIISKSDANTKSTGALVGKRVMSKRKQQELDRYNNIAIGNR